MAQPVDLDTIQEGSLQIQGVSTPTIFCEKEWIVWRVKPPQGELGDQEEKDRIHPSNTAILEQFGTRLEVIHPRGPKT